jgi:putative DNA primase/helicase
MSDDSKNKASVGADSSDLFSTLEQKQAALRERIASAPTNRPAPTNDDTEIARLAALAPLPRSRAIKDAAKRLRVDRKTLEREVRAYLNRAVSGQGRSLELPQLEPWPTPVDGAALLDGLAAAVRSYVIMSAPQADAIALWCAHTHCYEAFPITPRLAITSVTKGCGKTTLLDVLGRVVARPLVTANVTAAAVFRVVEKAKPTLLIDEHDSFADEKDELRGVLNSGHRKGGCVIRIVGDDHEPRQFATFAPVAIAAIGKLPETLQDRAIAIELKRRTAGEAIEQFRAERTARLDELARKLARWTADAGGELAAVDPDMGDLFNRVADNWRPLFGIAEAAGGDWPARARQAARAIATDREQDSIGVMLLGDVRTVFRRRRAVLVSSEDLVADLIAMEGRPWAEWKGKPITKNSLARLLRRFRTGEGRPIEPGDIWAGKSLKGYSLAQLEDAFERYLAPEGGFQPRDRENADGTGISGESQPRGPESASRLENARSPDGTGTLAVSRLESGSEARAAAVEPELPLGRRCDHCGAPGATGQWDWEGRPEGVWLHPACEAPWFDRQKGRLASG